MENRQKSASFLEPHSFQLRKRKRKNESDLVENSILNSTSEIPSVESKRKKTLSRFTSVASVLSTPMTKAFKKSVSSVKLNSPIVNKNNPESPGPGKFFMRSASVVKVLQQHNSNTTPESPLLKRSGIGRNSSTNLTPYKKPAPTPNKQRPTKYWSEQYPETCSKISRAEIKLQEAIFELQSGEEDLVSDLNLLRKTYAETLVRFKILHQSEADLVFAKLYPIIPLHHSLAQALNSLRNRENGLSKPIGKVAIFWVNSLKESYMDYCGNLIQSKAFIDHRRDTDKDFNDFLQRCIESPFSRKLDLWSYLDVPRSRLVKYPLLLRQVLKFSNANSEFAADINNLNEAIESLEKVIKSVDTEMAKARANFTVSRLEWLDEGIENKLSHAVYSAKEELISGTLRNNRGTKLECYLLDTVLILGRPSSRLASMQTATSTTSLSSHRSSTSSLASLASTSSAKEAADSIRPTTKRLQVYRTPIPTCDLIIEDLNPNAGISGSFNSQGSFKKFSGSSNTSSGKNGFRVSFKNPSDGQSHTLFAPDEHSKKTWISKLKKVATNGAEFEENSVVDNSSSLVQTPKIDKRIYAVNGKVTKNSPRIGLFQKNSNRKSPRIKASLSQTALESVKSGVAAKKIRSSASAKKLQLLENNTELCKFVSKSTSKLPKFKLDDVPPTPPPKGLKRDTSKGCLVAAAVGKRIVRNQINGSTKASPALKMSRSRLLPPPVPPKSSNVRKLAGPRPRTKSLGELRAKNASYHGESIYESTSGASSAKNRRVTRSATKKVSKSMSDLMEL